MKIVVNIIIFLAIVLWLVYYFESDWVNANIIDPIKSKYISNINNIDENSGSQDIYSGNGESLHINDEDFDENFGTGIASGWYVDYITRDEVIDVTEEVYTNSKDFVGLYGYYSKKISAWKNVNVDKFLNTILNLPTNQINYDAYISIIDNLHKWWKLTDSEYKYYKTFWYIMQLKFDEFNHDISTLNYEWLGEDKINFIKSIYASNDTYKSYKSPPKYYLIALMSSNLLTNGYYEPARRLATEILKINDTYILTNQVMLYYNFILNKYNYTQEFAEKLIKIDPDNGSFYKMLLWITYYESEKYSESISILQNIDKSEYSTAINKYILSSQLHIWDRNGARLSIQNIMKNGDMDIYDYQSVRQYLFFVNNAYEWGFFGNSDKYEFYNQDKDFAEQIVNSCRLYSWWDTTYNEKICNLWKVWLQVPWANSRNDYEDIINQLTNGTVWVDYIYGRLGDYYTYIWDKEIAKQYYIQSYRKSDDQVYKQNLKIKVMSIFK